MAPVDIERGRRWRVGARVPLNIYQGDRPVCQCHTEADAYRIVRAMNELEEREARDRPRIEQLLKGLKEMKELRERETSARPERSEDARGSKP